MAEDVETPYDVEDLVAFVQEGEFLPVKNAIISGAFSARVVDHDGCSLLHWAAINNRIQIAKFLVKNGAESLPGGILGETPLHWALRKKYYAMAQLLHEQLHLDLSLKSKQGLDALNLVIRLGDINAAFMLLTWGANPNAEDSHGICPLLWLMQNNNTTKGYEISKLLIQFGATVTCVEPRTKNSLLHFLALSKKFDLIQAFYLYHNNPTFFRDVTNAAGQSVYKLATMSENRKMAKFLLDATLFHLLPTWIPTLLVSSLWVLYYVLLFAQGFIYGSFLWAIVGGVSLWGLGQHYVISHRDRMFVGSYLGFGFIGCLCFQTYIADIVSAWMQLFFVTLVLITGYLAWQVHRTRPQTSPKDMQVELTQRIIDSAPSEGTDEENQELVDLSHQQQHQQHQQPQNMRLAVVKDAFTGRISVVKQRIVSGDDVHHTTAAVSSSSSNSSPTSQHEAIVRLRSLGPRLCGHCLTDKRCIELLPGTSSGRRGHSGEEPKTSISIATHCIYCQACVLDQDHHCAYLNACIGRGNRRLFVFFQLALSVTCFVYFFNARYLLFDTLCDPLLTAVSSSATASVTNPSSTWSLSVLWGAETCLWSKYAHFAFVQYLSLFLAMYAGMVAYIQCVLVMKETTLHNLVKQRTPLLDAQRRSQLLNNLWCFLQTGRYTVVYPKNMQNNTNAATPSSSTSSSSTSANPSSSSAANNSSNSQSQMNNREDNTTGGVRSMLSALSATVKSAKSPGTETVSGSSSSGVAAIAGVTGNATGTTGSVVSRLWQRLEQPSSSSAVAGRDPEEEDNDETPLLYHSESQKTSPHHHTHRKRNGSFTTSEPPPTILSSSLHKKQPLHRKSKKSVSFASHNQYQSPPTSHNKPTGASVMTSMPPKFPNLETIDLDDTALTPSKTDLEGGRGNNHLNSDGDGEGSSDDDYEEEDGQGSGDYLEDEEDDYDPEFVESDLNGYFGSGRSKEDEEAFHIWQQRQQQLHHHHHHHNHDQHSEHETPDEMELGQMKKNKKKTEDAAKVGVETFQRQSWVR